jgi:hypothetical protein
MLLASKIRALFFRFSCSAISIFMLRDIRKWANNFLRVWYIGSMAAITIPKTLAGKDDLVVIPKKELDALIERAGEEVTEKNIVRWAREARRLGKAGKLLPLSSLRRA